jgi:hypothetical protein
MYALFPSSCYDLLRKHCKHPVFGSVADPGCLSWIPDPDFYPSRISDPGSRIQKQLQKRVVKKKIVVIPYFVLCSNKFHKILNYFIFELLKKNILAKFKEF